MSTPLSNITNLAKVWQLHKFGNTIETKPATLIESLLLVGIEEFIKLFVNSLCICAPASTSRVYIFGSKVTYEPDVLLIRFCKLRLYSCRHKNIFCYRYIEWSILSRFSSSRVLCYHKSNVYDSVRLKQRKNVNIGFVKTFLVNLTDFFFVVGAIRQ